jgi:hypothetical protein
VGATPNAVERHPHLAEPVPDGWVRVDMHSHTMWSGDSTTTPDEIVSAVLDTGIDVLCITDHHAVHGAQRLERELPCRVVVGEEVRTHSGELIGLFVNDRLPPGSSAVDVAQAIRSQGGIVYVPHPFDPMRRNISQAALDELVALGLIDVIEIINAKTSLSSLNRQAASYAVANGLATGAGSDAHVPLAIGAAVVDMPDFDGAAGFLAALRDGMVRGHHWDEARPWTARVVPSTVVR